MIHTQWEMIHTVGWMNAFPRFITDIETKEKIQQIEQVKFEKLKYK
jgi:hypothetical protein